MFDYIISPKGYDATTNINQQPFMVKLWIVSNKDDPTTIPAQGSFSYFFQMGSAAQSPSGAIADMLYTVNDDLFELRTYRTHKLGFAVDNQTSGAIQNFQYFANNDFQACVRGSIDVTKYLSKTFVFNDNAPYPNNSCLFCVMEAVPITGFTNGTQQPLNFVYSLRYEYTDA